jgi:hypothetical protein
VRASLLLSVHHQEVLPAEVVATAETNIDLKVQIPTFYEKVAHQFLHLYVSFI